ncbi:altronate oxidoreductase [Alkalihalobacillus pseudalcaliphilus]|nr:altronate oxidoreductase [Alkalihalobacillus pseudalcaliphilus]
MIQIGEGNFMRGFLDWMLHQVHRQGLYDGYVVSIQPTPHGKVVPVLQAQDNLYTTILRGKQAGEVIDQAEIIESISRSINPYTNWTDVLKLAQSPDIKWMFSNTTEAGLVYQQEEYEPSQAPLSFPGKVTAFLFERYQYFDGSLQAGLYLVPCELIENNGQELKRIVLQIAKDWELPQAFLDWVVKANIFCNTLVDRIVPGFPKGEEQAWVERLGYDDHLLTVAEPYHLFVVEPEKPIDDKIPFQEAGLEVKWGSTEHYREIKVRLLNGLHTMMFAICYLSGEKTVSSALENTTLRPFIEKSLKEELVPVVVADEEEKRAYADSVLERFENPFLAHQWTDIGLNAIYKFRTRLLPTLKDYEKINQVPERLIFSLAALLVYMKPTEREGAFLQGEVNGERHTIRDTEQTLLFLEGVWHSYEENETSLEDTVFQILENEHLWGKEQGLKVYHYKVLAYVQELLENKPDVLLSRFI